MNDKLIRVAITHGDTNGIGYEVIMKALEAPEMLEICTPIIYGSPKVAAYYRNNKPGRGSAGRQGEPADHV